MDRGEEGGREGGGRLELSHRGSCIQRERVAVHVVKVCMSITVDCVKVKVWLHTQFNGKGAARTFLRTPCQKDSFH